MADAINPLQLMFDPAGTAIGAASDIAMPGKTDLPEAKTAPVPDDLKKKRAAQRRSQRKYAGAGRAGTMLTDDSKLG